MKFFLEIKNRFFLTLISFFLIFNIFYFYKNSIIFVIINPLILDSNLNFYLIYTNVFELFNLYYFIINYSTFCILICFVIYHLIIFLKPAIYITEYEVLKNVCFIFLIVLYISQVITLIILPYIWFIFEYLNKNFILNTIHCEVKILEYFLFYYSLLKYNFIFFGSIIIFFVFLKFFKKLKLLIKLRKIVYILFFILIQNDELFLSFIIFLILLVFYELIILIYFLEDKIGFEPIK